MSVTKEPLGVIDPRLMTIGSIQFEYCKPLKQFNYIKWGGLDPQIREALYVH